MSLSCVGLYMPKNIINVGAAIRASGCYGASLVVTQGRRYKQSSTDTSKAYRNIPVLHGVNDLFRYIPFGCIPIAIDVVPEAISLPDFVHPDNAFYIFGPEDGTLNQRILDRCKYKVYVPTYTCMNLAATVNVVLYDRMTKKKAE